MKRIMFKSKIHRARVTQAELYYEGSITIDAHLMSRADILEYEKVQVVNVNNGHRFETYALRGDAGSGTVCLNGAAARLGHLGDDVIIITYAEYDGDELDGHAPKIILVDEQNNIKSEL
ncbi:MAG: aspartate 1-decarboxylase [Bacteroidetes bacterium]|nr:aspartate 1-decarboxylase [Bacteroidota bacterium]